MKDVPDMKLYKTYASNMPFGLHIKPVSDGLWVQCLSPISSNQEREAPAGVPSDPIAGFTINREFIVSNIGSKAFTDITHVYIWIDRQTGALTGVKNKLAETMITKATGANYIAHARDFMLAQVYIPFVDANEADWVVRLNCNPDVPNDLPSDMNEVGLSQQEMHDFAISVYPSLLAGQPALQEDGSEIIEVQLTNGGGQPIFKKDVRVFAKTSAGYINKSEAYTDPQGRAIFRARRLDLGSTDPMVVEFGFKFLSNIARAYVPSR